MVPPRSVKLEVLRSVRFDQNDAKRTVVIKGTEPAISAGLTRYLHSVVVVVEKAWFSQGLVVMAVVPYHSGLRGNTYTD